MAGLRDTGRAVLPKLRSSALALWPLDEDNAAAGAVNLVGAAAYDLVANGADPLPGIFRSPTGMARRFTGNAGGELLMAPGDAAARDALEATWTAHSLIRLRTTANTGYHLAYVGTSGDAGAPANNYVMAARVGTGRSPSMFWEQGAGSDVVRTATDYLVPLNRWTLITWRKLITTPGPGPVGMCTLALFVNGVKVEEWSGVTNTSGGTSADWVVGGVFDSGGAATGVFGGDIGLNAVYAAFLSDDEIRADWRRLRQMFSCGIKRDHSVLVTDGNGDKRDLTELEGRNWVDEVTFTDSGDQSVSTGQLTLVRDAGLLSLSAQRSDSKLNLTDVFDPSSFDPLLKNRREIEIRTALVPTEIRARPDELGSRFAGRSGRINWGGKDSKVAVPLTDLAGILVATQIEKEFVYGDDPPIAVQDEMQAILDDNDDTLNGVFLRPARFGSYAPITLYVPEAPFWDVLPWAQRREAVLAALRTIAGQIGWDVRFRFDENPDVLAWRLTFYEPQRDRVDADFVLLDDDYTEVPNAERNTEEARTVCEIMYPGSTDPGFLDAASLQATLPTGFTVEEVGQEEIDDQGNRLPAFVRLRADEADPDEIGRIYTSVAEASTSQIDTQAEAVRMCLGMLRDVKAGIYALGIESPWLLEADFQDIAELGTSKLHTGPQRQAINSITHRIGLRSMSTANLSGQPKVGRGRWFAIEAKGRNARPPAQNSDQDFADVDFGRRLERLRDVNERSQNLRGGRFLQTFNHDFSRKNRGPNHPPDGWEVTQGTWGTELLFDEAVHRSGGRSVLFDTATGTGELTSLPISLGGEGEVYAVEIGKQDDVGARRATVRVDWYDEDDVFISSSPTFQPGSLTGAGSFDFRRGPGQVAPTGARFARLVIGHTGNIAPIWVDSCSLVKTAPEWRASLSADVPLVTPVVWQTVIFDVEDRDYGANYDPGTGIWTVTQEGPNRIDYGGRFEKLVPQGTMTDVSMKVQRFPFGGGGFVDFIGPVSSSVDVGPGLGIIQMVVSAHDERPLGVGDQLRVQVMSNWTGMAPDPNLLSDPSSYFGAKLITAD